MTSNLHSVAFSLTSVLVIVVTDHAAFSIFSQLVILTGAVMLAGLPHGALDPLVANYLMGASSFRRRSLFYLNYLIIKKLVRNYLKKFQLKIKIEMV